MAALLACGVWTALAAWRRDLWLFALPVGACLLNASPWTGWVVWDEFDVLLLSTLAGAWLRRALVPNAGSATGRGGGNLAALPLAAKALLAAMALAALLGLVRAAVDASGFPADGRWHFTWPLAWHFTLPLTWPSTWHFDWFASYPDPLNSLRVAKSELYALLFVPLLPRQRLEPFAWGMVAGLSVVVGAVLWERLAFPGLWNFDLPYRSTALFWEMHVGGEAIDGYLALAAPFAAWAVLRARTPTAWALAALLAVLATYAVLVTFSRGVYGAVLVSFTLLALLLSRQQTHLPGWRARAASVLALLLVAEVVLLVASSSFLWQRVSNAPQDAGSRLQHWTRGLSTLQGPSAWLLGLGPGRLPVHYAASGPAGEWSGAAHWDAQGFATLSGPATRQTLGGQFALAQRTRATPSGSNRVRLTLRVPAATMLMVEWCERHLLYDGRCQSALIQVAPTPTAQDAWQTRELTLQGQAPAKAPWHAPRLALFTLSVVNAGGVADIAQVQLLDPEGQNRLANPDFAQGLAHWQATAQSYFLPWHIDSLFLELLIERGLLGLLLFATLLAAALWQLTLGRARHTAIAPFQAAALVGALCVGVSGSLLDVPRVAFLIYGLALLGLLRYGMERKNDATLCGPADNTGIW